MIYIFLFSLLALISCNTNNADNSDFYNNENNYATVFTINENDNYKVLTIQNP